MLVLNAPFTQTIFFEDILSHEHGSNPIEGIFCGVFYHQPVRPFLSSSPRYQNGTKLIDAATNQITIDVHIALFSDL